MILVCLSATLKKQKWKQKQTKNQWSYHRSLWSLPKERLTWLSAGRSAVVMNPSYMNLCLWGREPSLTYLMLLWSTKIKSVDFTLFLRQTWSRLVEKIITIMFFSANHKFHFYMNSGRFYKEIANIIATVFFLLFRSGGIWLLMISWFSVISPATWSDLICL